MYLKNATSTRVPATRTFGVDCFTRLDRFLILGTEGGSYYADEKELTFSHIAAVNECLKKEPHRTVQRIIDISTSGRAPKNEPALYALAMAASFAAEHPEDAAMVRRQALGALPKVARTGTHLLHFVSYVEDQRGWGRTLKRAVADWFLEKSPDDLVYQTMKYRSRDDWSMCDLLRLSHPRAVGTQEQTLPYNLIFEWITRGWPKTDEQVALPPTAPAVAQRIQAFESLQQATSPKDAVGLITAHRLPRETVPTHLLKEKEVWEALLPDMGITALIRNLPTLTRAGLFNKGEAHTERVASRLTNPQDLIQGRVHPINILVAMLTYVSGASLRGKTTWEPNDHIAKALNDAFYLAFAAVVPTRKSLLLALDVSGSMDMGAINGVPGLTPRRAAAAMAMTTVNSEPFVDVVSFSVPHGTRTNSNYTGTIQPFPINRTDRFDEVMAKMDQTPFGATDCALPALWAMEHNKRYDAIIVYTDSQTNTGWVSPAHALAAYRKKTGLPVKMIVQAFVSNDISIADPEDPLSMDINGLDASVPALMADFILHGLTETAD